MVVLAWLVARPRDEGGSCSACAALTRRNISAIPASLHSRVSAEETYLFEDRSEGLERDGRSCTSRFDV